jgi:uncharacterized protein
VATSVTRIVAVHSAPMARAALFQPAVVSPIVQRAVLREVVADAMSRAQGDNLVFDRDSLRTLDRFGRMHVAKCRISKANVCPYYGREIPGFKELGLDPQHRYMLYRDPEELAKAAPTFKNLPLLMLHTKTTAADPHSDLTVGTVGGEISFDGTYLVADHLSIWTRYGIHLVESQAARELSSSYHFRADMSPGRTPAGVAYDGVMRDIKGNHVALVPRGRAGSDVVVNDALLSELHKMKRPNLLARLIALKCLTPGTYEKDQLVALDEQLAGLTAQDSMPMEEDEDDEGEGEGSHEDPERPRGKKKGKMNPGKGKAGTAGGALASDEDIEVVIDAAIKSRGYMSRTEVDTLVNDAVGKATMAAVGKVNALHVAREAVKPLVGMVAMDSAEAVYKFALEKDGVALDGVPEGAFAALVAQRVAMKTAQPVKVPKIPTADAAGAVATAFPGLGRIQVA